MAITETTQDVAEINEFITKSNPLFAKHKAASLAFEAFTRDYKTFEMRLINLMNAERNFERRMKEKEAALALVEKAAKDRLAVMEHGHRQLVEDLNRKQLEADRVKADAEKTMRKAMEDIAGADAARRMWESRLEEINSAAPKKK